MLGWSIVAKACRSSSNRATHCLVSIPSLVIFEAIGRRNQWLLLLSHVDNGHSTLANILNKLVPPYGVPGFFCDGRAIKKELTIKR